MFIYSQFILRRVQEIKERTKEILTKEMRLTCAGSRFYDRLRKISYPIQIVIYNHRSMLGYFDSSLYELGFHEKLLSRTKKELDDVIRHELAHYLTWIQYGESIEPHGKEFQSICQSFGWGKEISRACMPLSPLSEEEVKESAVLRKVKKLLALGSSAHAHEAEQAMIKSQELLLKSNLASPQTASQEEETVFMQRVLEQKKETAKMRAIGSILQTFFVSTVYHKGVGCIYLEIIGEAMNVEIAEYVAEVLDRKLEQLWNEAKKTAKLKGALAKNSFFLGIAKGYTKKIESLKQTYSEDLSCSLILLDKKLIQAKDLVYPRLSYKKTSRGYCPASSRLGEKMGKDLQINPAIRSPKKSILSFLEWFN